jgi:hypothetical protein
MHSLRPFSLVVALFASALLRAAGPSTIDGNYIIPVPTELAAFASFPTTYTLGTNADGKATIGYHLPEDVVGPDAPAITLSQTGPSQGGLIPFQGPNGSGSCRQTSKGTTCVVAYPSLSTFEEVQSFLQHKYPNDPNLELRTKVARFFNADPKGIVNFNLPGSATE